MKNDIDRLVNLGQFHGNFPVDHITLRVHAGLKGKIVFDEILPIDCQPIVSLVSIHRSA